MDITLRIAGEAGQGVQTTGRLLVEALAETGLHVVSTQSYMSRVRGGLNWYDVRIGDAPLHAPAERADVLVALTDPARDILAEDLADGGVILYNGAEADGAVAVDFDAVAKDVGGAKVYANTVAAGAVFGLLGYDVEHLVTLLADRFGKKGQDVVRANEACARKGAELVGEHAGGARGPRPGEAPAHIYNGASAIGLAAAAAGVKLAAAYPMTPGTATFTVLAGVAEKYGIVVEQVEDEIAAVNMACGAAYAGVPVLVPTSGGGFALMAEGVSLAGIAELPLAILIAQRPGPATGMPTRTAQQDLLFAVRGGHGEFPRAVYAPGTVRQCYDVTRAALAAAHKHQTPVIILTDQFLQDMEQSSDELDTSPRPIDRCIEAEPGEEYARYAVTDSGVSPRAVPGGAALVVTDSDEHTAAGHLTEDLGAHLAQQDKRMRKQAGLLADAIPPQRHGPDDAETLLLTWGSTYGPAREAVDRLAEAGEPVAMVHFAQVWPLDADAVGRAVGSPKRVVSVEGNQTGQFATLLRGAGLLGPCELLSRYDGMPFTAEYILERIAP